MGRNIYYGTRPSGFWAILFRVGAMNPKTILNSARSILVIDWPSKEVPETLALAGFQVFAKGGPGPEDFSVYEVDQGRVVSRYLCHPPHQADLVYSYRPFSELREILALASKLQAKTLWTQSGLSAAGTNDAKGCWLPEDQLQSARSLVEAAGLYHITEPYIADVAREARATQ